MAAKKTARKKTTAKTTATRTTARTTTETTNETPLGQKSCAFPSCSQRATQQFGDRNVPSCDLHAETFTTQAQDGAGIQHLMETYKGP